MTNFTDYLGNNVYAEWDGYNLILVIHRNGQRQKITIDEETWAKLVEFASKAGFRT